MSLFLNPSLASISDPLEWIWSLGLDLPDYPSWVASYAVKSRYVFCDNTSSTDTDTSSDSNSGKHNHVSSKPAVLADCNRLPKFRALGAIAEERIKWVCSSIERAIRANESTRADRNQASIQEGAVEVDINVLT